MSCLCLSCGAPFIPVGEDMVEYDRLGNISIFYLQKLARTKPAMMATIKKPTFCSGPHSSHILHKTHHYWAVHFMADNHIGNIRGDEYVPFIRAPTGKRPERLMAIWDDAQAPDMHHRTLSDLIVNLEPDGVTPPDYQHEVQ